MLEVIRAEFAGACYGVQRALDLALEAAEGGNRACTLGPLIHNPRVVARLADAGVTAVDAVEDVPDGQTVIIRSHGVTPQVKAQVADRGLPLVDATCPHVARAQKAAAGLAARGMSVIVVGEEGHPEVEGILACARQEAKSPDMVMAVASPADLPESLADPVGVVVQTTQTRVALDAVVGTLRLRGIEPVVKNTICFATTQRQEAAASLAQSADALVVIGGRNSSNTTRLADICRERCAKTYHIEDASELQPSWFEGCAVVGVTAGASTPEDQIAAVVETLESLS